MHTGQHHDDSLSAVFFRELGLPRPDRELGIGGGSNTSQLARQLAALEPLLAAERPDAVLVYGDTNSTLAGALAASQAGVPVVHVEAGMRSFDRTMPEERNRVVVDHLSELLLCASSTAAAEPARGVGRRARRGGRRRDGRPRAARGPRRPRGHARAGGPRGAGRRLPAAHRPPPRQRRSSRAAARAGGVGAGAAGAGRLPAAPPHPRAAARGRAAGGARRRRGPAPRPSRSATARSPRWCATPARCSPTPGASRRRRTLQGCRASRCVPPPSGSRPCRRGGTRLWTSTPPRRSPRWNGRRRRSGRRCMGTGTPPSGACRRSVRSPREVRSVPSPREPPGQARCAGTAGRRPAAHTPGAVLTHVDDPQMN